MSYTVNDETIQLNREITALQTRYSKVQTEAAELWIKISQDLINHQNMMFEMGALVFHQNAKEKELREAVERG